MKKLALLLAPLFMMVGLSANSTESQVEENSKVRTGTTIGHYAKPGAPIDMTYVTSTVDKNETVDINITLTTTARMGSMDVAISFDDKLSQKNSVKPNLTFEIVSGQKEYTINLQAASLEDGLYYIRLLTKINKGTQEGVRLRSFAIPVIVGEGAKPKTRNTDGLMLKARSGENLSVSKAVETIRVAE